MIEYIVKTPTDKKICLQQMQADIWDKPMKVTWQPYKKNRTLAQNKLLHALIHEIKMHWMEATGECLADETWKEYLKHKFLPSKTGMINGEEFTRVASTTELKVDQFSYFIDSIYYYASEELNLTLEKGDRYLEAQGEK